MSPTKLKQLQRFENEKELRENVLLPLFERMGFHTVLNHGVGEFGKDIIISKTDAIGNKKYTALVVKKGSINVGNKADATTIFDVARQVKEAYRIKYNDPTEKKDIKIDYTYVVCDGNISDNAKTKIVEEWGNSSELFEKNTEFISGDKLVKIIHDNWPIFFETNSPEYYEFAKKLILSLEDEEKIRSVNIDENIQKLSKTFIKSTLFEFVKSKDKKYTQKPRNPDKVFSEVKNILIVGESGTGKSYLIREEIKKTLKKEMEGKQEPRLKIYIKLSEFSNECLNSECLYDYFQEYIRRIWDKAPSGYAKGFIDSKRIDFFLDGYDEIPTESKRTKAKENITYLIAEFPKSQFVITTREISALFNQEFPESFTRYNLSQINYKQAVEYLELIVKNYSSNGSEILKQIKTQEILLVLPRTPMTVQLISSLFSEGSSKEIPSNTTEVYKIFTELMLGRWDRQRDVTNIFDYEQKLSLLSEVAYFMQKNLLDYILYEKAVEMTENFIQGYGGEKGKGAALLSEIINRSELLISYNGNVRFKHRSFQEYFSAHRIHNQGFDFKIYAEQSSDPWWENVITFLCGFRKAADEIINYIINLDTMDDLDDDVFKFRRGKNLGLYVRAGYQSKIETKKKSILQSINDFNYCYSSEELEKRIEKIIKKKPGKKSIHMMLQLVLGHSYYSKLTESAVIEIVEEIEDEKSLSYLLKLVADYGNQKIFDQIIEKINKVDELEIKRACAIVAEGFTKKDDVKLLESKEFRKLKKAGKIVLKRPFPG